MFDYIFNNNDLITLEELLKDRNETITTAESCTGGLIASMITSISGSSEIFKGGIVTYSNEIKEQELGVLKETMIEHGAVSKEVVTQMLEGAAKKFSADYAIAVSGVAGPNGGTETKPVGTVVIGVINAKANIIDIEVCHFEGDRKSIQMQASKEALKKVFKFIQKTLDI